MLLRRLIVKEYDSEMVFTTRIIESKFPVAIKNPLLSSIVRFGSIPTIGFIFFWTARAQYIAQDFLIAYSLALLWVSLGPYLIWYYDQKLLPEFFQRANDIVPDREDLLSIERKYTVFFSRKFWIVALPWSALLIVLWANLGTLPDGGVLGESDPVLWIALAGVAWLGLLTGIGFSGVVVTLLAVREVCQRTLRIDPLHSDSLGGLSCVGHYAIGTTLLFSSGSLFLPLFFAILSRTSERLLPLAVPAVAMFSGFILMSFLYPTKITHTKAAITRDRILEELREKHAGLVHEISSGTQNLTSTIRLYLELYRLRNEYSDYKSMSLYPFEFDVFVGLIGSVALPLLFILLEWYVL
jgi:hypothetical protein